LVVVVVVVEVVVVVVVVVVVTSYSPQMSVKDGTTKSSMALLDGCFDIAPFPCPGSSSSSSSSSSRRRRRRRKRGTYSQVLYKVGDEGMLAVQMRS